MAISKLIFDGEVQMDVTQDTVTPNSLLEGYTATAASGEKITGNIETKTSSDVSVNGPQVTIPEGYYDSQVTASVATTTGGIPTATKGTVSNHSIDVTPSVTNSSGYISAGTITGNAVTVQASELVSGSQAISSNGIVDVTNLAEVVVDVPPNNQDKTVNPSLSQQTVSADSGYTGLGTVTINAIHQGTAGVPIATKGTVTNNSVSITPSVTNAEGYISSSNLTGDPVTVSASELVSGSRTIIANQTVDVTNLAEVVVDVGGTIYNQNKTVTPTTSTQQVTFDEGYSGLGTVTVNAMPEGEEGTPEAAVVTDPSTQNIVITPRVTNVEGYIPGGLRVGDPVTINPGVTSFNGETGDVTYTAPVTSVNGSTGAVTVSVPTNISELTNDSGYVTSATAPVRSVNGNTGAVTINVPTAVSQLTNDSGYVTSSTAPVRSVNGKTGAVTLTIPATPNAYVTQEVIGGSQQWSYRKWSNGACECWGSFQVTVNVTSTWGSLYYGTIPSRSYPVTFTNTDPREVVSLEGGNDSMILANAQPGTSVSTNKTGSYLVIRGTSRSNCVAWIDYFVRGTV